MEKTDNTAAQYGVAEGEVSVSAILRSGSRQVFRIFIDKNIEGRKKYAVAPLERLAKSKGVVIEYADRDVIDGYASGTTHGGVCALVGERIWDEFDTMCPPEKNGFYVVLDGIEDPFNFGQALRAIYAAGADGVILPKRNWMSASSVVARSSAGASEFIPACVCDVENAVETLAKRGYKIVCTDHSASAVSMLKADLRRPLLLLVGGERRGISAKLKAMATSTVRIDYGRRFDASLGAAEASAILAFEVLRQNSKQEEIR